MKLNMQAVFSSHLTQSQPISHPLPLPPPPHTHTHTIKQLQIMENEYRKATAGTKVTCRLCNKKFYPDKLRMHRCVNMSLFDWFPSHSTWTPHLQMGFHSSFNFNSIAHDAASWRQLTALPRLVLLCLVLPRLVSLCLVLPRLMLLYPFHVTTTEWSRDEWPMRTYCANYEKKQISVLSKNYCRCYSLPCFLFFLSSAFSLFTSPPYSPTLTSIIRYSEQEIFLWSHFTAECGAGQNPEEGAPNVGWGQRRCVSVVHMRCS